MARQYLSKSKEKHSIPTRPNQINKYQLILQIPEMKDNIFQLVESILSQNRQETIDK